MKNTFKSRDAAGLLYPESGGGGGGVTVVDVYITEPLDGGFDFGVQASMTPMEVVALANSGGLIALRLTCDWEPDMAVTTLVTQWTDIQIEVRPNAMPFWGYVVLAVDRGTDSYWAAYSDT